jgi:hypothetical protein
MQFKLIFNLDCRDLIIQNSISIFEFRMYLFSRQIQCLLKAKAPNDICARTIVFVSDFSSTLKKYKALIAIIK